MDSKLFYKAMSEFYDLIDIVYLEITITVQER